MPEIGERHLTAGPSALREASSLLGLRLEGFCALGLESLTLFLGRIALILRPKASGLSCEADPPEASKLARTVETKLEGRSFRELLGILERDPQSFAETLLPGQDGDRVKVPCVGQSMGLLEAGWRNFYCDQDFEVLLGVPGCAPNDETLNIEYADLECFYARPKLSFKKWSFMDYPEEEIAGSTELRTNSSIVTELEERDMILGTGEKADALVEKVRTSAAGRKVLVFTHLCTPIVMGEDLNGLSRRCEKACGGRAVSWTQKDRDRRDNFGEYFRSFLAAPGLFDSPSDPLSVNLFHFPAAYRKEELEPFLAELGLTVNMSQFPDVDFTVMDRLPRAAWQVFCERSAYPVKLQELLEKFPRGVVRAKAPYGIEGTRACVAAIAAACGRSAEFERAWKRRQDLIAPEWESLRREAEGLRVAFVVGEATLPRLLSLRFGLGAPLLPVVREMGFGVDLLYFDRHGRLPQVEGARVAAFRAPWELEKLLREGRFQAVYSDLTFDRRLTSAGKARFSSKDFELGLGGALRTFRRLTAACRLPFYERYAGHLGGGPS